MVGVDGGAGNGVIGPLQAHIQGAWPLGGDLEGSLTDATAEEVFDLVGQPGRNPVLLDEEADRQGAGAEGVDVGAGAGGDRGADGVAQVEPGLLGADLDVEAAGDIEITDQGAGSASGRR
jgi:hypothetical protein